nr:MAG TPA: hypothetical protein [Caudoviricetes sp.]
MPTMQRQKLSVPAVRRSIKFKWNKGESKQAAPESSGKRLLCEK